jgi:hypothetical protein
MAKVRVAAEPDTETVRALSTVPEREMRPVVDE